LKPKRLSVYALAKRLRVPGPGINDIALEKRGITADTAVQWRFFGTTEQFWLDLQGAYVISRGKAEHSDDSESYRPPKSGQARI
jgi:addiction module HigA family antidote